jgi:hypothetical protein
VTSALTLISATLSAAPLTLNVRSTSLLIAGIVAVLFGLLIFAVPRLLNYLVALYLVVTGALLIWSAI